MVDPHSAAPPPLDPPPGRRFSPAVKVLGVLVLLALPAIVLYGFPPEQHAFYPRCLLHSVTGWDCPGCGGLRATHQLLHGNVRQALKLNPFILIFLPITALLFLGYIYRTVTGRRFTHPFQHPMWLWILAGAMIVFGIARNLPTAFLSQFGLS